jgi:hypothetical protein
MVGELAGPGPGRRDAYAEAPSALDQAGGGVQQAVAQGFGLGAGQVAANQEEAQAQPGEQVLSVSAVERDGG